MRTSEAQWIQRCLATLTPDAPLLNVGSSTAEFRQVRQPHIDRLVFAPLRSAGWRIVHSDLKPDDGVDISGDLADPKIQDELRALRPRVVLCSNMLEHVPSATAVAKLLVSLLPPGGIAIVTVPRSYPFHPDPIDTGLRPTPEELFSMFPGCELLVGEVVEDCTYARELLRQRLKGLRKGARTVIGALRPFSEIGRAQRDRLRWLFRPFTTTCIMLRAGG